MDRGRRRRLAEDLAAKVAKSRKDVVSIVLFGSVARGDDGPDSDVEIAVIVRRGNRDATRFVFGGVLFNVYWYTAVGLRRQMLEPDGDATKHGFLDGQAVHDPSHWFARLRSDVARLPPSFYRRSAQDCLHKMYEYVCKARNARRRGDEANMVYATGVVGYEARVLAALLNRRHFRSENSMTKEWRDFPDLPPTFRRHVQPLLSDRASVKVRYASAMKLWRLCVSWSARHSVRLRTIRGLGEVRLPKTT